MIFIFIIELLTPAQLPEFSEVNAVRDMFMGHKMEAPLTMQITHVGKTFAYSVSAH